MVVLGINFNHPGSAAALFVDGKLVFAQAEERLNRRKNYCGFPELSIKAALAFMGLESTAITHIALAGDSKVNLGAKLKYSFLNPAVAVSRLFSKVKPSGDILSEFQDRGIVLDDLVKVQSYEHHLAHMSSAYYFSGFESAAGLTIDGSGDFVSMMIADCKGSEIRVLEKEFLPVSIGNFYFTVCQFIGYGRYGDEGKVMGLAALGDPSVYRDFFARCVSIKSGSLELNKKYFRSPFVGGGMKIDSEGAASLPIMYSDEFKSVLGTPREKDSIITQRDMDLAAALQERFEDIYAFYLKKAEKSVSSENIALAGGVCFK